MFPDGEDQMPVHEMTIQIRIDGNAASHGRGLEAVERIERQTREAIASHPRWQISDSDQAGLVVTVHHRWMTVVLRGTEDEGALGVWSVRYDPAVPGSAAKQARVALGQLLDDIARGVIPPSADPL